MPTSKLPTAASGLASKGKSNTRMPNMRMFQGSSNQVERVPLSMADAIKLPKVPDGPNCQHNRKKNYEADFTKPAVYENPNRPGQPFLNLKGD